MTEAGDRLIHAAQQALDITEGHSPLAATTVFLDRRHKAVRMAMRWEIYQLEPSTGQWRIISARTGPRKIIHDMLEAHRIAPSREAEAQLRNLPERTGFRKDQPE